MAIGDFSDKIKRIEERLLALKTASEYSSVRTTQYSAVSNAYTGMYRVTYQQGNDEILSTVYCGASGGIFGFAYARTTSGNIQIIEVSTDEATEQGWVTHTAPLIVVSNVPVTSITRI